MSVLVLDTDIASLSHKRRLSPVMQARIATSLVCVSFVTVGELVRWEEQHDWGLRRRKELASWLGSMITLPYDGHIAHTWGRMRFSAPASKK